MSEDTSKEMMPTLLMIVMKRLGVDSITVTMNDLDNIKDLEGLDITGYDPLIGGRTLSLIYKGKVADA